MPFKSLTLTVSLAAALVFASCATTASASKDADVMSARAPAIVATETGMASWYGPGLHGRRTPNGEVFDQYAMSAAHRTWPMGSQVRVTNLENGSQVTVRLNDRGPFARGRIIDVSRAAARELGFEQDGWKILDLLPASCGDVLRAVWELLSGHANEILTDDFSRPLSARA